MTCRRCGKQGQRPSDVADKTTELVDPATASEPARAGDPDAGAELGENFHLCSSVPPDRPLAGKRATEASYRFAWNG